MSDLPFEILEAMRKNSIIMKRAHLEQSRMLVVVMENPGISQKALSDLLHIRPQTLGELLTKREASGFIERVPNKLDKRITNIYLTDSGLEHAKKLLAKSEEKRNEIFSDMSEKELKSLIELINKLNLSIENHMDENDFDNHHFHSHKGE